MSAHSSLSTDYTRLRQYVKSAGVREMFDRAHSIIFGIFIDLTLPSTRGSRETLSTMIQFAIAYTHFRFDCNTKLYLV